MGVRASWEPSSLIGRLPLSNLAHELPWMEGHGAGLAPTRLLVPKLVHEADP